jgi:hypothetical protein
MKCLALNDLRFTNDFSPSFFLNLLEKPESLGIAVKGGKCLRLNMSPVCIWAAFNYLRPAGKWEYEDVEACEDRMTDPVMYCAQVPKENRSDTLHMTCRKCAAEFWRECARRAGLDPIGRVVDPGALPVNSPAKKRARVGEAAEAAPGADGMGFGDGLEGLEGPEQMDPFDELAEWVEFLDFQQEAAGIVGGFSEEF